MNEAPDDQPEKTLAQQIKAHPGLALAGGVALGVLASALLPRGSARRLAKGAIAVAAAGSEAGLAMARQARETARSAASEAGEHLGQASESAGELRRRATAASGSAVGAGLDTIRTAVRLLGSLRR